MQPNGILATIGATNRRPDNNADGCLTTIAKRKRGGGGNRMHLENNVR